jgi:uncharacterized membrane protein YhhN
MDQVNISIILGTICLAGAVVSVVSEWRKWRAVRALSKMAASTAFVALALENGAAGSGYGRLILVALISSWAGDALLLSLRSSFLLAGIAAFLLAHAAFASAFASQLLDTSWLIIALLIFGVAALALLRWLWPHLETFYKIAVPVYLAAIMIMTSLAVAVSAASMSPIVAIGAITFAASDVSVARDRFIASGIANKAWGLPLYYAAQILLAMSVLLYR